MIKYKPQGIYFSFSHSRLARELADVFEKNEKKNKTTSVYRQGNSTLMACHLPDLGSVSDDFSSNGESNPGSKQKLIKTCRGTQRECSSKLLKHSIVKRILIFKR